MAPLTKKSITIFYQNFICKIPPKIFLGFAALVILSIGVGLGMFIKSSTHKVPENEVRGKRGFKHISPLLECSTVDESKEAALMQLEEELQEAISQAVASGGADYVSLYFQDLQNGAWFGIAETEIFAPASLVKIPLAMSLLREAAQHPDLLKKTVVAGDYDYEMRQTLLPDKHLMQGQTYTLEQLMEYMIIDSDNQAHNLLMENINQQILRQVYDDIGIDIKAISDTDPLQNFISVKDYALLFNIIFNASYLSDADSERLLMLLTKTKYKQGLVRDLGEVEVAHKFGERSVNTGETQLHDCGIVYIPKHPYLICIMTKGSNLDRQADTIAGLSGKLYQSIKNW